MRDWEVILAHLTTKDKISLILTCKHFANYFRYILEDIKDLKRIESEYCKYNPKLSNYAFISKAIRPVIERSILVGGTLYDILCTGSGLPFVYHTKDSFTPSVEKDIKKYLKFKPQSIFYCIGNMRCRDEVSPFMIACHNDNIPVHIIRLLLDAGANPNTFISVNRTYKHILQDVKQDLDRYEEIIDLLLEYGADLATKPPKTPLGCMKRLMI